MARRAATADQLELPRVRTLGAVGLWCDGAGAALTGKPARAFAALITRRDGLTLDEIAEIVWPTGQPASARSALHVHLGTLRGVLDDAPDGISIERAGSRYRLEMSGWALDLDLVDGLVADAQGAVASQPSVASELFEQALSIWSGTALVVDGEPISAPLATRYELARLNVEEMHVDALLQAGRSEAAEVRAVEMVEEEPYRERRWAQLMRARLDRDRAADALSTFRRARRRLVEDLGVEPGPELRALERSILTRDLAAVEAPDELDAPPRPFGPLIGRGRLLERVETAMGSGAPTVLLGAPGVGKTRLAIEVAVRAERVPRKVGWLDLRNAAFEDMGLRSRVQDWARASPGGLVVLDNADRAVDLTLEIIAAIERLAPSVAVLVTSRIPLGGDHAVVPLRALALPASDETVDVESSDAVQALRSMLGFLAPETALGPQTAARLVRQLGGLPLALRLAADLARTVPLDDVADIAERRMVTEMAPAVTAVLDHLPLEVRDAFAAVSTLAGPLDADVIGALAATESTDLVRMLIDYGLTQFDPSDPTAPYSIPEPIREVGVSHQTMDLQRRALDGLVDHCIERTAKWPKLLTASTDRGERLSAALGRELVWHRQAIAHCTDIGDPERALRLVSALEFPLYGLGWWAQNTELQDAALAIPGPATSVRAGVHAARGRPGLLHQFDESHLVEAIEMARRVDDLAIAAKAQHLLGICRWSQGRHDEAVRSFESAGSDAERAGDVFTEIECRRYLGIALVTAGDVERGFALQTEVLEGQQRRRGTELHIPHVRMYLGHCRRHVGDDVAALVDLEASRADYERIGNRASLIHILAGLADVYADRGVPDRALDRAARGLELSAATGITTYDAWILCSTARVHADASDADRAVAAATAAAASAAVNWRGERHRVAAELASVAASLGDVETSARLLGLADASDDRRELPFRSPAERRRLEATTAAVSERLGGERLADLRRLGGTSALVETVARLHVRVD